MWMGLYYRGLCVSYRLTKSKKKSIFITTNGTLETPHALEGLTSTPTPTEQHHMGNRACPLWRRWRRSIARRGRGSIPSLGGWVPALIIITSMTFVSIMPARIIIISIKHVSMMPERIIIFSIKYVSVMPARKMQNNDDRDKVCVHYASQKNVE